MFAAAFMPGILVALGCMLMIAIVVQALTALPRKG
jgi:TRAP-type C4-dicarboxylate transport system permease large subunit